MTIHYRRVVDYLKYTLGPSGVVEEAARLELQQKSVPARVPGGSAVTDEAMTERWELPGLSPSSRAELADPKTLEQRDAYSRNIENFIGTVKVPIGLAGPLRV